MNSRFSDLILPLALISVIAMMIFPLPVLALDFLLMCNITFAVALLISCVYLLAPAQFTSLPATLLLATIFRLGLNISTTRQLLSSGEAPEIVSAFGTVVVGGNLIVGIVIFAIVTIIQFLVIAKGAERVAEVAARFSLDAMPGRQMSIDADIRAGILGPHEAREQRGDLQTESKLYGALDGAMKFVKGDAIAAVIITLINIVAGLLVGVTQLDLSMSEALHRFTLYTVGDGLCSQIPALLVSIAAGIAVTRVQDREGNFLGREIVMQLGKEPQALLATSGVLIFLALMPGLPTLLFAAAGIGIFVLARKRKRQADIPKEEKEKKQYRPKIYSALVFRLNTEMAAHLQAETAFVERLSIMRKNIFEKSGVLISEPQFDLKADGDGASAEIFIKGIPTAELKNKETFFEDLEKIIFSNLLEFVDDTHSRILLDLHATVCEDLVNSVIPEIISVTTLTKLLRELVGEKVSVSQMSRILQTITEWDSRSKENTPQMPGGSSTSLSDFEFESLLAEIRICLGKIVSANISSESLVVKVARVNEELEKLLIKLSISGMPPEPNFVETLLSSSTEALSGLEKKVVVTNKFSRRLLAKILKERLPEVLVIAAEEISTEIELKCVVEI